MSEKNLDIFKKIIEEKKEKSAKQGVGKRAPSMLGNPRAASKKQRKGGLFDK